MAKVKKSLSEEAEEEEAPKRRPHLYDVAVRTIREPEYQDTPPSLSTIEQIREMRQRRRLGEIADMESQTELMRARKEMEEERKGLAAAGEGQQQGGQASPMDQGQGLVVADEGRGGGLTFDVAERFSHMDKKEQENLIDAYTRLSPIYAMVPRGPGGGGNGPESMWPMLLTFAQRNPGSSSSDLIEMMKAFLPLIKSNNPQLPPQQTDIVQLVRAIKELTPPPPPPGPSAAQGLKETLSLVQGLKDLGVIASPKASSEDSSSPPPWQIELEKIRTERDLKMAELGYRQAEAKAKDVREDKRLEAVTGGLLRVAQTVGDAIGGGNLSGLVQSGQAPAPMNMEQPLAPPPPPVPHNRVKETCPRCGQEVTLVDPVYGQRYLCTNPKCGEVLVYGPDQPPPPAPASAPGSPPPPPPPSGEGPPSPSPPSP